MFDKKLPGQVSTGTPFIRIGLNPVESQLLGPQHVPAGSQLGILGVVQISVLPMTRQLDIEDQQAFYVLSTQVAEPLFTR